MDDKPNDRIREFQNVRILEKSEFGETCECIQNFFNDEFLSVYN